MQTFLNQDRAVADCALLRFCAGDFPRDRADQGLWKTVSPGALMEFITGPPLAAGVPRLQADLATSLECLWHDGTVSDELTRVSIRAAFIHLHTKILFPA